MAITLSIFFWFLKIKKSKLINSLKIFQKKMLFLSQAEVSEIISEVLPPEIVEKIYMHYVDYTFRRIQQEPHYLADLLWVVPGFARLRRTTSIVSLKSINMSNSSGQADLEKAMMSLHNNNCSRYNRSVANLKRHLGGIYFLRFFSPNFTHWVYFFDF